MRMKGNMADMQETIKKLRERPWSIERYPGAWDALVDIVEAAVRHSERHVEGCVRMLAAEVCPCTESLRKALENLKESHG